MPQALRVCPDGEFDIAVLIWPMSPADHNWVSGWFISDPICLILLLIMALYMILLDGLLGATPGKFLHWLGVVGPDSKWPGLGRSIVRNFLRTIDSLPILNVLGVILILKPEQRARFGDRVARMRMIDLRPL
jgi:uncharacterized RDD family membrane protein YckC